MRDAAVARQAAPPGPSPAWVLASLALCVLLPALGTSIANVALPSLALAFGASFQQVQWVVLAYLLASTALIVSVGRLGDLIGRRRLLLAGVLLFTAASLLCGLAAELWVLIAARALQGLGAAIMMALAMALVSEALPKARAGRAMGLLGAMSALGTALGPTLGGLLIARLGWQAIFLVTVPLGLLALVLVQRGLPAGRSALPVERSRFDVLGTLLLALTLTAYALAMTWGRGRFGLLDLALLGAAAVGVALFLRAESRTASPLIHLALFRDRALTASLAMTALVSTVMMATLVVGPFYLAHGFGLDMARVGLLMSVGPVVAALAGVPAGRLTDRWGAAVVSTVGLAGMLIGCLALGLGLRLFAWAGVLGYVFPIAGLTASYALFQAANNTAVMGGVAADQRGLVSGLLNLARNLGLITGASMMGAVFAIAVGASEVSAADSTALVRGTRVTFAVAAGLLLMALLIELGRRLSVRPAAG